MKTERFESPDEFVKAVNAEQGKLTELKVVMEGGMTVGDLSEALQLFPREAIVRVGTLNRTLKTVVSINPATITLRSVC